MQCVLRSIHNYFWKSYQILKRLHCGHNLNPSPFPGTVAFKSLLLIICTNQDVIGRHAQRAGSQWLTHFGPHSYSLWKNIWKELYIHQDNFHIHLYSGYSDSCRAPACLLSGVAKLTERVKSLRWTHRLPSHSSPADVALKKWFSEWVSTWWYQQK